MATPSERPTPALETADDPVELVAPTRPKEARTALALVAALRHAGVAERDIVLVARDVDQYEDALRRAARRYDVTLAVWTPLRLDRTVPNRLAQSLCAVLATQQSVSATTLCRPLRLGWVPPESATTQPELWPLSMARLQAARDHYRGTEQSLSAWLETCQSPAAELEADTGTALITYLEWLAACDTEPTPATAAEPLLTALARYERCVLEPQLTDQAVSDAGQTVRGIERTRALTRRAAEKYGTRLSEGLCEHSWAAVADLLETHTSMVPGRRENPTAHAVDVMEANNMWARERPYVIAVGLVDGEWPRRPTSVVPAPVRERIRQPSVPTRWVRPRAGWTERRDADHFWDTTTAATQHVVCTRHTHDHDGTERHRSVLLDRLDTQCVSEAARRDLIATGEAIPPALSVRPSATAAGPGGGQ